MLLHVRYVHSQETLHKTRLTTERFREAYWLHTLLGDYNPFSPPPQPRRCSLGPVAAACICKHA